MKSSVLPLLIFFSLLFSACGITTPDPSDTEFQPAPVEGTQTPETSATSTPTPEPTATMTATPETAYPVFDKAEDILTPEKLPYVPMEDVLSGKHAEMVLKMYNEGKIRQISPAAKPYPFIWGNEYADSNGKGSPMVIYMTQDEKIFYEQHKPYTFALFQTEFQGEKVVLVDTIWLNKDRTVSVMPQTIPFSIFPTWQNSMKETLTRKAPTPYKFENEQTCMESGVHSQQYCQWQMSIQDEWLAMVKIWVETGIIPPGLSRLPLHMISGPTTYYTY